MTLEPNMRQKVKFTRQNAHTTGRKNCEGNWGLRSHPPVFLRDAPVVLLPQLVVITGGIGLFHTARTSSGLTSLSGDRVHTLPSACFTPRRALLCGSIAQQKMFFFFFEKVKMKK